MLRLWRTLRRFIGRIERGHRQKENAMAKGQLRSTREKKKPKKKPAAATTGPAKGLNSLGGTSKKQG